MGVSYTHRIQTTTAKGEVTMYRISKIASIMCCRMPCCRENCMAAVHSLCSRCTDVEHPHCG